MTKIIGFQIYQTEDINIQGKDYIIRFSLSHDGNEYLLFVSNVSMEKEAKYPFSQEVADDFKSYTKLKFKEEIIKILKADIEKGLI